jgi:hypothetical protein
MYFKVKQYFHACPYASAHKKAAQIYHFSGKITTQTRLYILFHHIVSF